jgi:GNAT superfamily N-acetyltransferase
MPPLELKIEIGQFHQLPRHPAYKYEYFGRQAWLSPRPRFYHALLPLDELPAEVPLPASVTLRAVRSEDWDQLPAVFAAAFRAQQPFSGLENEARRAAAQRSLTQTRTGGDGPWIEAASFVAELEESPVGAILATLLPLGDPTRSDSYHWSEPPPPDCIARRLGQAHLTWIFVAPALAGQGVGAGLLRAAGRALLNMGYRELLSTFLLGNDSSMLWHWRMGFRLLSYPESRRHIQAEIDSLGH